jgi:dienelactone hydrolase
MGRGGMFTRALLLLALILLIAQSALPQSLQATSTEGSSSRTWGLPGPQGFETGTARRQLWLIPLPGERLLMHAIVLRPPGPGPFPLAVINHGSSQSSAQRATFSPSEYASASQWFLNHGFAIALPLRPGHGETGGPYFEDQGRCESANYEKSGLATADSIQATIDYLTAQPFVKKSGTIVVGQSAGGWGALALASRNPRSVRAVINFSGGRGGRVDDKAGNNCAPDRLIDAAGKYGSSARIPTLWLYSKNDGYFAPDLSKRMAEAFHTAGGDAEYHLLQSFGTDGHSFIEFGEASMLWAPMVEKFLAEHR